MFKPEGIMPALVTPFTYDQKAVDEEKLRFLVNHSIEQGVSGVLACGTTGEFTSLTTEERKRVIRTVLDEANGKVPTIAGTGASSTQQTLELTKFTKDAGVQAALIVAPYYVKLSERSLYEHFSKTAMVRVSWGLLSFSATTLGSWDRSSMSCGVSGLPVHWGIL